MKKLVIIGLLVLSVVAVNAKSKKELRKEKKAEEKAMIVEQTKSLIEQEEWHFIATQMLPTKGPSRSVLNYSVVIKDGNVISYLPYAGRAYSGGYDGNGSPLSFDGEIEGYSVSDGKKGGYVIKFRVKNKGEVLDYSLNVSSNGTTTLNVNSTKRDKITFYGNVVPIKFEEPG